VSFGPEEKARNRVQEGILGRGKTLLKSQKKGSKGEEQVCKRGGNTKRWNYEKKKTSLPRTQPEKQKKEEEKMGKRGTKKGGSESGKVYP